MLLPGRFDCFDPFYFTLHIFTVTTFYPEQNAKIQKNWKNASSRKSRSLLANHRNHATCLFGVCSWYTRFTLIVCWANKMWAGTVYKCCCDQHSLTIRAVKSSQVWCRAIQIHQRSLTSKCRWSKRIRLESSPRQISATSRSNSHKREWICGSCTVTNVGSLRRQCLLVQTLPSTKCRNHWKPTNKSQQEWVAQNWPGSIFDRRKPMLAAECTWVLKAHPSADKWKLYEQGNRIWVWPLILCTACSIEGRFPMSRHLGGSLT